MGLVTRGLYSTDATIVDAAVLPGRGCCRGREEFLLPRPDKAPGIAAAVDALPAALPGRLLLVLHRETLLIGP